MRLKGVHLVNQPWYISTLIAIVKPFMKQKMRKRVSCLHYTFICYNNLFRLRIMELIMPTSKFISTPMSYHLILEEQSNQLFHWYYNYAEIHNYNQVLFVLSIHTFIIYIGLFTIYFSPFTCIIIISYQG